MTTSKIKESYRIEDHSNKYGKKFAVVNDYHMFGYYFKTMKGAEKLLARVKFEAGEA